VALVTVGLLAPRAVADRPGAQIAAGHTGRFSVSAAAQPATSGPAAGEGVLTVTMAGPGTSWSDPTNTSVVVEAAVDGGQWQSFVLFNGGQPFPYSGFTGPLNTGHHDVTVTVDPNLSHSSHPSAVVLGVSLAVVTPADPGYLALANAPVMYERHYDATGDTPLLAWANQSVDPSGGTRLEYQTVWTHEDIGDTVVPANEWGKWGRMTDIDPTIWFTVTRDPTGAFVHRGATMDGCSYCPPQAPTDQFDGDDANVAFHGSYFGAQRIDHHPIIRVFTGNGDITDQGTTPFRFQQVLTSPPGPGQTREAVTDAHPWTYRIMAEEVDREYANQYSTDPRTILPGDARQYAIIDLDVDPLPGSGQSSIAVELHLSGDPATYSDDYAQLGAPTTYPFYVGGHGRTVVKLPLGWHQQAIVAVNLRLNYPAGSTPPRRATIHSFSVIELTSDYQVAVRSIPAITFSSFPELVPTRP
jgi:hypothetical protein